MLCERCKKREATTHLREVINGDVKETHLCSECASELGYDSIFTNFNPFSMMGVNIGNFLGGLFTQTLPERAVDDGRRCSFCGTTFEELANSAKAGCANCYKEFYNDLIPSIQRVHGKTRHIGKIPGRAGKEMRLQQEITNLRQQLGDAVSKQEYEKAAELRDKIKDMEKRSQEK